MEETEESGENHQPAATHRHILLHKVVSSAPRHLPDSNKPNLSMIFSIRNDIRRQFYNNKYSLDNTYKFVIRDFDKNKA
jgi:hypothetical protein